MVSNRFIVRFHHTSLVVCFVPWKIRPFHSFQTTHIKVHEKACHRACRIRFLKALGFKSLRVCLGSPQHQSLLKSTTPLSQINAKRGRNQENGSSFLLSISKGHTMRGHGFLCVSGFPLLRSYVWLLANKRCLSSSRSLSISHPPPPESFFGYRRLILC